MNASPQFLTNSNNQALDTTQQVPLIRSCHPSYLVRPDCYQSITPKSDNAGCDPPVMSCNQTAYQSQNLLANYGLFKLIIHRMHRPEELGAGRAAPQLHITTGRQQPHPPHTPSTLTNLRQCWLDKCQRRVPWKETLDGTQQHCATAATRAPHVYTFSTAASLPRPQHNSTATCMHHRTSTLLRNDNSSEMVAMANG